MWEAAAIPKSEVSTEELLLTFLLDQAGMCPATSSSSPKNTDISVEGSNVDTDHCNHLCDSTQLIWQFRAQPVPCSRGVLTKPALRKMSPVGKAFPRDQQRRGHPQNVVGRFQVQRSFTCSGEQLSCCALLSQSFEEGMSVTLWAELP